MIIKTRIIALISNLNLQVTQLKHLILERISMNNYVLFLMFVSLNFIILTPTSENTQNYPYFKKALL